MYDRLQRLQNRAGRIIAFSDYNTRSADILQDLGWDTLEQRRSKQLAISVFKSLSNFYPASLKNVFKPTSGVHSYTTYEVPQKMFLYQGPVLKLLSGLLAIRGWGGGAVMWNGLENVLKDEIIPTLSSLPILCLEPGIALRELR